MQERRAVITPDTTPGLYRDRVDPYGWESTAYSHRRVGLVLMEANRVGSLRARLSTIWTFWQSFVAFLTEQLFSIFLNLVLSQIVGQLQSSTGDPL